VNPSAWLETTSWLWSPLAAAALMGLAVLMMWSAFTPARPAAAVRNRLDGYLDRKDIIEDADMRRPFVVRVFGPLLRGVLHILGRLAPKRNVEATEQLLLQAGEPGRLSALDFFGLRLLAMLLAGGLYLVLARNSAAFSVVLRNSLLIAIAGFFVPWLWLRSRARGRQHAISLALPDALDMLTIGVEAGLAFESALLRVGERWHNPLTVEFRRAVAEMRIGTPRDVALTRMAERSGAPELRSFVAVLIQSNQLGMSIAQVLHSQAAEMRVRRRQRAEELARQASVKMVFPLVFLIFPALFVVILGPSIPGLAGLLNQLGGK
jgi:tight adherence protein C